MNNYKYASLLLTVILMCGCSSITEFPDPDNSYTAEVTYKKLVKDYPFINIASRDLPESVAEHKNLTYVNYGRRALQLDLYQPKNSKHKTPLVVLVHGGGWMHGYRQNLAPLAMGLAKNGYVAAVISYRLSPEAKYPAAIQDAKAAVRWLRSNAQKYGLDANHIAIAGGSAGGQIASLTGVSNGVKKFDPQAERSSVSSDVQAIINIDGLSDFTSPAALMYENDPQKKVSAAGSWFGGSYEEKPELWKEASPINYVSKNTPPMLFIDSAQTRFSVGRDEMIERMKPLGIPYQVVFLPDTPHSFWLFDPWLAPTLKASVTFLNEQFHYSWP